MISRQYFKCNYFTIKKIYKKNIQISPCILYDLKLLISEQYFKCNNFTLVKKNLLYFIKVQKNKMQGQNTNYSLYFIRIKIVCVILQHKLCLQFLLELQTFYFRETKSFLFVWPENLTSILIDVVKIRKYITNINLIK